MKKTVSAAPTPYLRALAALALLLALGHAREARAQWATSGANISNTNAGNVGIGTAAPAGLLEVNRSTDGFTDALVINPSTGASATSRLFVGENKAAGRSFFFQYFNSNYLPSGLLKANMGVAGASSGATNGFLLTTLAQAPIIFATGGVGTANERLRINSAGQVGVGTSSPAAILHVVADGSRNDGTSAPLIFGNATVPLKRVYAGYDAAADAGFMQAIYQNVAYKNLLLNAEGGNIGIGTTSPTERLHVNGNLKVTGNIEAKYQDVAEWVHTIQRLAAGTVVVLDPARSNHVLASASAYDTSVAGVVSAQPGIILGEGGEGKVKVATTGRVRVKVDATKGPIKIGDLLVTSDISGVAMKSEPITVGGRRIHAPGTIIGKALEPLSGGVGEILVLLSLQ